MGRSSTAADRRPYRVDQVRLGSLRGGGGSHRGAQLATWVLDEGDERVTQGGRRRAAATTHCVDVAPAEEELASDLVEGGELGRARLVALVEEEQRALARTLRLHGE